MSTPVDMAGESCDHPLAGIDAVILCGGQGTRLRAVVSDQPKSLAPVGGQPFMNILVDDLLSQGFRRVIFCVGHLKEQIIAYYRDRHDAEFLFSPEDVPLGTGGALANALPLIRSDAVLVVNGDSFCSVDFQKLYRHHCDHSASATLVLTAPQGRYDGGLVRFDDAGRILSFAEKSASVAGECAINAGIYLLQTGIIASYAVARPLSLEHQVFPALVVSERCFGFVVPGPLTDIGTPERYRKANNFPQTAAPGTQQERST